MTYDIYLVGVGGQGVLTIAEIITEAAVADGISASYFPTEGMAQRGGFVKAQVRLGRDLVGPNLPEKGADMVISMELSESFKAVKFIKPGGDFVIWGHVWAPAAVMLGKASYPSLDNLADQVKLAGANFIYLDPNIQPMYEGSLVPDNIFTLGAAYNNSALKNVIKRASFLDVIKMKWPKVAEQNIYAFEAGIESVVGDK